ncbi:kinetoplast-associated protein [Pyxidicoccus fallax]|uniref:Kinetoplast-associated protein n=1 Tax=Pyxidicoccus fallax TaxID=394095 RepID=A0A848LZE9_9BACT|nr:kinetoplast-associated protein [Pyxidicoccus fallax]NMO23598.1 kinetoplast-associated protein [Pyxidicoccus fallax]NPC87026.1 kinetoplast-associated protein [Pyxidicoccus fallax]
MATRNTSKRNAVARNRSAEATKAAFDDLARKARNKPVVVSKEQEAKDAHAKNVLADVSGLTAETAVKKVTEAGLTINKTLAGINEQVISLVEELKQLDEAIGLKTEELNALHGKDVAASAIDVLVAEYDKKKAELEAEMERLQKDITDSRAKAAAELAAEREAAEVARKRAEEQYAYDTQLSRKKDQDAFAEGLRQQAAQERDRKEKLEKDWATREEALKLREKELEDLRKQVAEFPQVLKKEADTAAAIAGNRVKSDWEMKLTLATKDAETAQRVATMEIASLKDTCTKQAQAIQTLQAELNEAKRQVQAIAEKALESASGARALAEVQGVIASREFSKNK